MLRAAALLIVASVASVASILALGPGATGAQSPRVEPTSAGSQSPVGVWRFQTAELQSNLEALQAALEAEYLPAFFQQYKLTSEEVSYFHDQLERLTPEVSQIFAGTVEFKPNGQFVSRNGGGQVRGMGQWEIDAGQVFVTEVQLRSSDPFHPQRFFDPCGWQTVVGNLVGADRIELQPPLDLPPVLRRAVIGFNFPLVRTASAAPTAEPDAE